MNEEAELKKLTYELSDSVKDLCLKFQDSLTDEQIPYFFSIVLSSLINNICGICIMSECELSEVFNAMDQTHSSLVKNLEKCVNNQLKGEE